MYVLTAMPDAEAYRNALAAKFPGLSVHAVTTQEETRPHMDRVEILVTIFRVADDLLRQAVGLPTRKISATQFKKRLDTEARAREGSTSR